MLDKNGIYLRFIEYYPSETPYELAKLFKIDPAATYQWKEGKRPVPWHRLKTLVDEEGISWDWLLEGKKPKYHRQGKNAICRSLDRHAINQRFLSLFPGMSQAKLAGELGVKQMSVYRWCHDLAQVPWERLKHAVDTKGVTWEWLIEGR